MTVLVRVFLTLGTLAYFAMAFSLPTLVILALYKYVFGG